MNNESKYKVSCEHTQLYKQNRETNAYPLIHANFIACSSQTARLKKIQECFCFICKTRSHRLHMCLDCKFVGCFERKHIHAHSESSKHPIGVDVTFGNVYCFKCNDYMYDFGPNESQAIFFSETKSKIISNKFLGLRGLVNLGQTCYINCIVQVLTHNPLLRNYFLSDKHNMFTCRFNCDRSTCLACEMSMLFQEFYSGQCIPHIPYQLVYIIWKHTKQLDSYDPQDAHEFFITMLEVLHEHLKSPKDEDSRCQCIIHKINTGRLQSDIVCVNCKHVRSKIEEFRDICLDLGEKGSETSLKDCLERYTQPELLSSYCDNCKEHGLSKKQLTVQELPVVICFHLKRLEYGKKITTQVTFPEYLNMTPFVSSIRGSSSKINEENVYKLLYRCDNSFNLFAVVSHSGDKDNGHYISFIKMKQQWYKCDDDIITPTRSEIVLESEGYLLFYHKERVEYDMKE